MNKDRSFRSDDETEQAIEDIILHYEKQGLDVNISNLVRMAIKQLAERVRNK